MTTESFRILSRRMINRINSMNKIVIYRKAIYASCGLKTINIQYKVTDQILSASNPKEKKFRSELAADSLIVFTKMGYSFAKMMAVFMMFISIFTAFYSLVIYIMSNPVAGWTTTILFLSFAFSGLFGILTIMIKYLQLLVNLVFKRKYYSFENIEKMTK